jgi:hypothetical protein
LGSGLIRLQTVRAQFRAFNTNHYRLRESLGAKKFIRVNPAKSRIKKLTVYTTPELLVASKRSEDGSAFPAVPTHSIYSGGARKHSGSGNASICPKPRKPSPPNNQLRPVVSADNGFTLQPGHFLP